MKGMGKNIRDNLYKFFTFVKLFLKKLFVSTQIIFYIIKYYIDKTLIKLYYNVKDKSALLELKSFLFVVLFSFFFYYFIVIELSILIFGYSLLSYRFLFILIVACFLAAWRFEVEFLRTKMDEISPTVIDNWISFYDNQTPLSFYDFLYDYKKRPLFRSIVVEKYRTHIDDGRTLYLTFFLFLVFFYSYSSGYKFDPRFVNFVAKYFHPVVNFFQSRANPRLEDFSSALIWFWNRLFGFLEYKYETHTIFHDKIKELTLASPRLEDWAHSQWGYKTSLRKRVRFNDIYFLRAIFPQIHLWKLVFDVEQPLISASWFDPNWKLLFFRYIAQEFNTSKTTFWKTYFINNNLFWDYLKDYKIEINRLSESANNLTKHSYTTTPNSYWTNYYSSNTLENMLAENYFNENFFDSKPFYQHYGSNWDYYHNIVKNNRILKFKDSEVVKEFFTTTAYINFPYTITGLKNYHKQHLNLTKPKLFNTNFLYQGLNIGQNSFNSENYQDLLFFLKEDVTYPLYNFYTFENFDKISPLLVKTFFSWPLQSDSFENLFNTYDYWLSALENDLGLREFSFRKKFDDDFTLDYMTNLIFKWIHWIKNVVEKEGFLAYLSTQKLTFSDLSYYFRKIFKLENFIQKWSSRDILWEWDLFVTTTPKPVKELPKKKRTIKVSTYEIDNFIAMELELWSLENLFGLWTLTTKIDPDYKNNNIIFPNSSIPWFIKTLKFFGIGDYKFVMPGFIRYYYPTPYPSAFSTFGKFWNKYQFWQRNWNSVIVGYSDSLAEIRNSTPIALYSGVEAILYFKPLLDFFDYFIWLFVKAINYIIELIITQEIITPLTSLLSLAFFVHLIWFIHFYIYVFIFLYLIYYFYVYYFWKIGFLWFYERLYQENFFMSYSDWSFWHTITELWYNYRTPEQFLMLALQTNLLLHYSLFEYNNYFFFKKNTIYSFLTNIALLLPKQEFYFDFQNFQKNFHFNSSKFLIKNECFIFHSFYTASVWRYQMLLFEGGTDVSPDHLVWTYFDYLNQINLFISWSLWKNFYFSKINKQFLSLVKQYTILLSTQAPLENFLFLSTPLLDSLLTRKLLTKLFIVIESQLKNPFLNLKKDLLFVNINNSLPINYILFLNYKLDFYNFFLSSGLDIYSIIKSREFNFLTKLNTASFWDDPKYWLLAFFRSFWFIPKIWFPLINLDLSYENTRLHLSWFAYANSWIAQSMVVRPHYNIIQHLWWTSKTYSKSFGLVNSTISLNNSGVSVIDNVRNFLEKRHSFEHTSKTETIFGIVTSLNLQPTFYHSRYGEIPFENKNFDLSFPDNLIDKKTTSRGYLKTNPPINLYELGITPSKIFSFFWNCPISLLKVYLTFLNQLDVIVKPFDKKFWDLTKEFKKLDDDLLDLHLLKKHELYAKYEFYFKQFDYLFWYCENKIESNFIFTFDISYFFNHFSTWDYFSTDLSNLWLKHFNPSKFLTFSETNNLFLSNFDMISTLKSYDYWIEKPFGILDQFELHSLLKYKNVKLMDSTSFSRSWDDPFLNLDMEHTVTEVGLSVYPKEDKKDLLESYSEEFSGFRNKRFPYNPTLIWNQTRLFFVGWVGELYANSLDAASMIYSLLYASPSIDINSWNLENNLKYHDITIGGWKDKIISYFSWTTYQKQLISRSFTWFNLTLSANSYRYSFGPKTNARFDYWSWKCGITLDYWNGLYSYWPYLGFRHSFFSRLVPYDNLYGFYKTYRQIEDTPLVLDLSTDVLDYLVEKEETYLFDGGKNIELKAEDFSKEELDSLLIPYREIYYSFHHPYFVGYLFFWMLILTTKSFYLGLSNFVFKWLLLREFLLKSTFVDILTFETILISRNKIENWFWKAMSKYRIYYSNPSSLTNVLDCVLDEDILTPTEEINTMHKFFLFNCFFFKFLNSYRKYSISEIWFMLDYKKVFNYNFLINWLTLDYPFSTNPYLVVNNYSTINLELLMEVFKKQNFNFSHRTSLRESYNYNLFFDWSSGTYLDLFNLSNYISSVRASIALPDILFSNPAFLAASLIKYPKDESKNFANDMWFREVNFINSDILISNDLALHNLSMLNFFQESLAFIFTFNTTFWEKKNFFSFIDFYIRSSFLNDVNYNWSINLVNVDSKILKSLRSNFLQSWILIFLYWIQRNLSYELLFLLLENGLFFSDWKQLNIYFKSLRFWLFDRYSQIQFFYKQIGLFISNFFFRKH